jgi:hypothetical protein
MGRARDISKVFSTNTALATDSEVALIPVTPTSIVTTGGSGSISTSGTVSFTSASAISLNDVFSATYNRYKIVINQSGTSVTSGQLQMRLRVFGSDNSSAQYRSEYMGGDSTTVYAGRSTGLSFWFIGRILNDHRTWCELDIINPFTSGFRPTTWNNYNDVIAGNISMVTTTGALDVTTSYTGFTIIAETGTMAGTISVYGYRD